MGTPSRPAGLALPLVLLPLAIPMGACRPLSESVDDPAAGPNGGFEIVRRGLPVNWLVYTPRTVPDADFTLTFDRAERREGEQSLRFDVRACTAEGGWRSPGLAEELATPPGTYRVGFWIRSEGAAWTVSIRGVSAKAGAGSVRVGPADVAPDGLAPDAWRHVERDTTLAPDCGHLRFELAVTSPGRLWIDGVRIEPVGEAGARQTAAAGG